MMTRDQIATGIAVFALMIRAAGPLQAKRKGGDHLEKGVELAQQKQYDAAIAEFTKAIEADPKDARTYSNRGTAYRATGKFTEAIADYSKAIEVSPKDYFGFMESGQASS